MKIESKLFGEFRIHATVKAGQLFTWVVSCSRDSGYATPPGHASISVAHIESRFSKVASAHEAEMAAAEAMTAMAAEVRAAIATATARYETAAANHEAALAATARLESL